MSKKKRTFNLDVLTPSSLRLYQTDTTQEKRSNQTEPGVPKKQFFSPELIARLTERIKKL